MVESIRVCDGSEEWVFDGEVGLTEKQIRELLSRTRRTAGHEPDLDHVTACCVETFGKQVSIWRVPGLRAIFSVASPGRPQRAGSTPTDPE